MEKRNIVNTGKWSTGYLTPEGNKMKEEYDNFEEEELRKIINDLEIKFNEGDIKSKDDLVYLIIKKKKWCFKMKANNQVASIQLDFMNLLKILLNSV